MKKNELTVAIRCAVEQIPEVDAVLVARCGECAKSIVRQIDGNGEVCRKIDCFSLPNLAELCDELLAEANRTAETINELRKDNAKLKAERDAAVADLRSLAHKYSFSMCNCCKNKGSNKCRSCHDDPLTLPEYEWRGVQNG